MNRRSGFFPVVGAAFLLASALIVPPSSAEPQAAPAAGGWKVFQEFGPLVGSWSGTADQGGRIGGRSVTFSPEVDGAALVYRANTFYPATGERPEEKTQELAFITYDGGKRKYSALLVFSTKVWGTYDVEILADGTVQLVSRELVNVDAGARSRIVLTRKAAGELTEQVDVAPAGKDFVPLLGSKLTKK
jgi:hypothetical protein